MRKINVKKNYKGDKGLNSSCIGISYSEVAQKLMELMEKLSIKYDVDKEEIQLGYSDVPPSALECLVYVKITQFGCVEYFRKNKSPYGRWVNRSNLFEKKGTPRQKGSYDLRKGIIYR